jgi:hypothetical protein
MTQNHALTVADDAIVSALSAVGEIMPASVRNHLVAASNWCWQRRLGKIDQPDLVAARSARRGMRRERDRARATRDRENLSIFVRVTTKRRRSPHNLTAVSPVGYSANGGHHVPIEKEVVTSQIQKCAEISVSICIQTSSAPRKGPLVVIKRRRVASQ